MVSLEPVLKIFDVSAQACQLSVALSTVTVALSPFLLIDHSHTTTHCLKAAFKTPIVSPYNPYYDQMPLFNISSLYLVSLSTN